ncbi:MAG TPA: hypothetical protein VMT10_07705 [Solirubrobacteraceae bacterium]|nr:hypothetical protein [Solirubrobacteraceae bacterium]
MPPSEGRRRTGRGARLAVVATCLLLLCAGAVVTATAAPGPSTDVKTAQYGGGTTTPVPTKGPCKGVGGEALTSCLANAKVQYKAALRKCLHKRGKARTRCQKAAKKKWVG